MFTATLTTDDSNVDISPNNTATVTITDIGMDIFIGFDPTTYAVTEGVDGTVRLRVVKTGSAAIPVTAVVTTVSGTAGEGTDYGGGMFTVTFGAEDTEQFVDISIMDDGVLEGVEMFTATLTTDDSNVDISSDNTATVTITDNDMVTVGFDPTTYAVTEGVDDTVRMRVFKTGSAAIPVTAVVTTVSGTAGDGTDYGGGMFTVTFGAGDTEQFVDISIMDDGVLEGVEMFTATLTSDDSNVNISSDNTATVTITDNDSVQVAFDPASYTVSEGGQVDLTLVKTGAAAIPVTVTLSTAGVTATAGVDYEELTNVSVVFAPDDTTGTVTLRTFTDSIESEGNEILTATITTTQSGVEITGSKANVTIMERDVPVVEVDEDAGNPEVCVDPGTSFTDDVTVEFVTQPGNANEGEDFSGTTGNFTLPAGSSELCATIPINDDMNIEPPESFAITFSYTMVPPGETTPPPISAMVTIIDNDVLVGFEPITYTISEGDGSALVTIIKVGDTNFDTSVNFSTIDGTAMAPMDYIATTMTVVFGPGESTKTVSVPIEVDDALEGLEMFSATLTSSDSRVQLFNSSASISIIDNTVSVGFDPTAYTVTEGVNDTVTLTVMKNGMTDVPVTVNVTTQSGTAQDGTDYEGTVTTLTFAPGEVTKFVDVAIMDDAILEGVEMFTVTLTSNDPNVVVPSDSGTAQVTITDNDSVSFGFTPTTYSVTEGVDGSVTLTVMKSGMAAIPVTVNVATVSGTAQDGTDYTGAVTTLTFAPGEVTMFVDVPILDDDVLEGMEMFTATLTTSDSVVSIPSDTDTATVNIIDDDVVRVGFEPIAYTINEEDSAGSVNIRIIKVGESAIDTTVDFTTQDGTAVAPMDYMVTTSTVVFGPLESEMTVSVPINNDDEQEMMLETFFATLTTSDTRVELFDRNATVSIVDNDGVTVILVNDSVIADPQYTLSLPEDGSEALCYEVHGSADDYYNIISDTCTSVNAHYTVLPGQPNRNRMSTIGIHAVVDEGATMGCTDIQINLLNCAASVDGNVVNISATIGDIRVRRFNNRWRVSVPNCRRPSSVMWITCEASLLRFDVVRGSNLRSTSHGLLGQFWNIPIRVSEVKGSTFIEVYELGDRQYRRFPVFPYPLTWDHTERRCYYAGNIQGGPETSINPSESVIEGMYTQYQTSGLFDTDFDFKQFDDSQC